MSKKLRETIIANVKAYPTNISAALRLSASQTGVTYNQAQYAYYGSCKPSRKKSIRATVPTFAIITDAGMSINTHQAMVKKASKYKLKLKTEQIDLSSFKMEDKVAFFDMVFK